MRRTTSEDEGNGGRIIAFLSLSLFLKLSLVSRDREREEHGARSQTSSNSREMFQNVQQRTNEPLLVTRTFRDRFPDVSVRVKPQQRSLIYRGHISRLYFLVEL